MRHTHILSTTIAAIGATLCIGCVGAFHGGTPVQAPPPPAPIVRPLGFHTCTAGSKVWLDGAGVPDAVGESHAVVADKDGYAPFPVFPGDVAAFNVHATAKDHDQYAVVVHDVRPAATGIDYFFGDCEATTWHGYAIFHPLDAWPARFTPLPRLTVRGQFFAADGQPFTAIETSDFNLYSRYLAGEDITPVLAQRQSAGFNLLRVWLLYDVANIGHLIPAEHADFYTRLPAFLRLCASYELRVELTVFTGAERLLPGHAGELAHLRSVYDAVGGETNVIIEMGNEFDEGDNRWSPDLPRPPPGLLVSAGSVGAEEWPTAQGLPILDYQTFHTNGAGEEARKVGHNAWEIWAGPTLTNETSRYPDAGGMWGDGDPAVRAYDAAAGAALLAAGSCFHSIEGKTSTLWSDATLRIAQAWAAGGRSVPLSCQNGAYVHRQDLEGSTYLRVYQRGGDDRCIVRIRQ